MVQTVWLVRHGNRQDFVDPAWRDTAERPFDPGLSPDGIEQAKRVGERLRGEGITHIFASPYLRTIETAHHIADALDLIVYPEPGMGEWLNPHWFPAEPERLSLAALKERFPRLDTKYTPHLEPTYPETEAEALERAGYVARHLAEEYPKTILLVGHGISVTGAALGLVPSAEIVECALCSLFKIIRDEESGEWLMELCGDVTHLGHSEAAMRFI